MRDNQPGHVILVYRVCPICGQVDENQSEILMQQRKMPDEQFKKFMEMDKKAIGFGQPCEKCKEDLETSGLILIEVDAEKTTDKKKSL